jgi:hypothetical protein
MTADWAAQLIDLVAHPPARADLRKAGRGFRF